MHVKLIALVLIVCAGVGCSELSSPASEDVSRITKIDQMFAAGDYDQALAETTNYLKDYPESYRALSMLGWVHAKTDDLETARECFDASLAINPKWDNAYVGLGVIYRKQGDTENARKSYLEAIRLLPDNAEAFSSLLVIELMEGADQQAVAYGEKAWKLKQNDATIPANLSIAYHYVGDFAKRDQFYQHAKRLGYNNLQALDDLFEGKVSLR